VNIFAIIDISRLKEHEEVDLKHLKKLKKKIESDGVLKTPIAVDMLSDVIIDGHHRFVSLKELGYKKVPVVFIDYFASEIIIQSWRDGMKVTKDMVIQAGLTGKKLHPKTTKNMIRINGELKHISTLEKKINVRLKRLK